MRLKSSATLWLAAALVILTTDSSLAGEVKISCEKGASCKTTCQPGVCKDACELDSAAATCGTTSCIELLGKLAGLDVQVEFAKACRCSDACKCAAACKCSAKKKCQPACKCDSSNNKSAEVIWGEVQAASKKGTCAKSCPCKQKGCCAKAIAKKRKCGPAKKLGKFPAPSAARPHPPLWKPHHAHIPVPHGFHGPHGPVPFFVPHVHHAGPRPHAGPKGCPHQGTHAWHMHAQLVKVAAENAKLKAANEAQQQLMAQQKEHQKQMLEAQAQIMRLQNQVELVSRKEEVRDQLVEVSLQAAQAEWLLEVAAESPEAFLKMVGSEPSKACSQTDCEVHALKAENKELRTKIGHLEKQIHEIIKRTAHRNHHGPNSFKKPNAR